MTLSDYYKLLGLQQGCSLDDIKKAYRKKARLYHPDINPAPEAKDIFISTTEAYEFLIANFDKLRSDDQAYTQAMEDWRRYRQDRSRHRAKVYARASYISFKKSEFYKTTRIFDGTTIMLSFVISIMVLVYTVYGYIFRLKHPIPGIKKPTVFIFIIFLLLGMIFLTVSFIYLKAYIETSKKHRKRS
jgi:curved DNA-binding protein CbpA